jgi:hypothetical protein
MQMKKTFGLLILCALALAADDSFVGTWKLNVAKSKFSPGPAPQSQTVTIGADNKVEGSGTDSEGQAVNWSYTATPGTATITGLPDASVMETRKGHTVDHSWKFGGNAERSRRDFQGREDHDLHPAGD